MLCFMFNMKNTNGSIYIQQQYSMYTTHAVKETVLSSEQG